MQSSKPPAPIRLNSVNVSFALPLEEGTTWPPNEIRAQPDLHISLNESYKMRLFRKRKKQSALSGIFLCLLIHLKLFLPLDRKEEIFKLGIVYAIPYLLPRPSFAAVYDYSLRALIRVGLFYTFLIRVHFNAELRQQGKKERNSWLLLSRHLFPTGAPTSD